MDFHTLSEKLNPYKSKIEIFAVIIAMKVFISKWLLNFDLLPDSTCYLSAAMNFAKHGSLFYNVNAFSRVFTPSLEPLTEYAPGYPLYLSFFVYFFKDPILSAAIAQGLVMAAFCLLIYRISTVLDFSPLIKILTLVFFSSFEAFRGIFFSLLTEPLYICLCLGVFLFSIKTMKTNASRWDWIAAFALVFLASSMRYNGFSVFAIMLLPILMQKTFFKKTKFLSILLIVAAAPNLLWFFRNSFYIRKATATHVLTRFLYEKAFIPFQHSIYRWGFGYTWLVIILFLVVLAPLFIKRFREKISIELYANIGIAIISQFIVVYILSLLIFDITPLDDRFLSPSYTFFALLLFYSLDVILKSFKASQLLALSTLALMIATIPLIHFALKKKPFTFFLNIPQPVERKLWQGLSNQEFVKSASHYYTDENYIHQIFSELPQRILPSSMPIKSAEKIPELWNIGNHPFFVVNQGSFLHQYFVEQVEGKTAGLKIDNFGRFIVYHR